MHNTQRTNGILLFVKRTIRTIRKSRSCIIDVSRLAEILKHYESRSLVQIYSYVNPNALQRYFMDDYEEDRHTLPVVREKLRFTCQREMVRDLDREQQLNDGFAYWRTTGRLIVTWHDGSATFIEYRELTYTPVVIDCGYDEGSPF